MFDRVVNFAYTILLPALPTLAAITVCQWGCAALLILPQAVLLGMTFRLMSENCVRRIPARSVGNALALDISIDTGQRTC